jgi:hypothetical protein
VSYGPPVDIFDEEYGQGNSHQWYDKDVIARIFPVETIFKGFAYKMHQVFDDHSHQPYPEAYHTSHQVEKPVAR